MTQKKVLINTRVLDQQISQKGSSSTTTRQDMNTFYGPYYSNDSID